MSNDDLAIKNFKQLKSVSEAMAQSGYFSDARSASKAMAKIMFGKELNVGPASSMSNIHIIKGKPSIGSHLIAAKVKQSDKYDYQVKSHDNEHCVIEWFEGGEKVGQSSFTIEQAEDIGLLSKDNWQNYPENMLFARALSNGAKFYCPDVFITGVYTPEEMEAVDNPPEQRESVEDVDEEDFELVDEPDPVDVENVTHDPKEEVPLKKAEGVDWAHLDQSFLEWIIDNLQDRPEVHAKAKLENKRREEEDDFPIPATDSARELAEKEDVDLSKCSRSEKSGKVRKSDVKDRIEDRNDKDSGDGNGDDNDDESLESKARKGLEMTENLLDDSDVTEEIAVDTVSKFTNLDVNGTESLSDIDVSSIEETDLTNIKAMFRLIRDINNGDEELEIDEDNALKGMIPF